ncbi:MAG TPA: AMP-binding protein [Xanthobacteraceae bacterium]|nr:AMP-binding protein [Xanthobacteraceae bacterium]
MPKLLRKNAADWPTGTAIREKKFGIWQDTTWTEALSITRDITLGLQSLGVDKGSVVGLIGQNRPNWLLAEIAVHSLQGLSLGIYKDSLPDEVKYLVDYASIRVVIAEDEEQVCKFLHEDMQMPSLEKIVVCDLRGMGKYDDPRLISFEKLLEEGRKIHEADPLRFSRLVDATPPDADAILCTTSGTTSRPKIAVLQSGPFLEHSLAFLESDPKYPGDNYVSVLPLPWIGEQVYAVAHTLLSGLTLNFVEEEETSASDLREISPCCVLYPPRVWESLAADIRARMFDSTRLKRTLFVLGMRFAEKALEKNRKSFLAELLIGRALRDRLGMSRMRSAATGGAPLGPEIFKFFRSIGVPLRQLYGQTEMAGVYTGHRQDDVDFDTVGYGFRGVELKIENPDRNGLGEIIVRHPGMFTRYYRNPEETAKTIDQGWMRTGDAGYLKENGHLVVIDRVSDLAQMRNGDRFSPLYIENKMKFSPFVAECVVHGQGRDSIAAMVCIRFSILSKWAEARKIAFNGYSDLSTRAEVRELIREEIEKINSTLPGPQKVRRFLLLYKELDADDGELTRTRKIRRSTITERYGDLIEALYTDRDEVNVDTTINLQDGKTQRVKATIRIVTMKLPQTVTAIGQNKRVA